MNKLTPKNGGTVGNTDNITGAFSHLVVDTRTNMLLEPTVDHDTGGWTDKDGGTSDLFLNIDGYFPETGKYIKSEARPTNDAAQFGMPTPERAPKDSADHVLRWMYRVRGLDSGWTLDFDLLDGATTSVLTVGGSQQETSTGDVDWTENSYTLTSSEVDNFTTYTNPVAADYADLRFKIQANGTASVTEVHPDEDLVIGTWVGNGGETEDLWDLLDQTANNIVSGTLSTYPRACSFGFPAIDDVPDINGDWKIIAAMKTGTGADGDIDATVRLRQDNTVIAETTHTITSDAYADYTITLSAGEKAAITDWSALNFVIEAEKTGGTGGTYKLYVREVNLEFPPDAVCEVAWVQFDVPDDNVSTADDESQFFIGTETNLYQSNGVTFDEVTRGSSDYGGTTVNPTAWDFCSYGQNVIATNFADEVQVKAPSDSTFDDLITSTLKPNARFCMTVAGHLVLGDINDSAGSSNGQADEVWWSGLDAPETFKEGDPTTGSDRQVIYHTPGRITGLTGRGDYGLIWKRDSIVRLDYLGDDIVFEVNVLSNGIGCPFPKSIVEVGADIFFCTGYSFARLSQGGIEIIGENEINKWFFDDEFEDRAFHQTHTNEPIEMDNTIVGAYDRVSGNIMWGYYNVDNSNSIYNKGLLLLYNVRSGLWSSIEPGNDNFQNLVSNLNIQRGSGPYRGVEVVHNSGGHYVRRFEQDIYYNADIRTAILSSASLVGEENTDVYLEGVRPVIRGDRLSGTPVIPSDLQLTVYYGDTPQLDIDSSSSVSVKWRDQTNGMMPVNVRARYFLFAWSYPTSVATSGVREFLGAEYFLNTGGMHA